MSSKRTLLNSLGGVSKRMKFQKFMVIDGFRFASNACYFFVDGCLWRPVFGHFSFTLFMCALLIQIMNL